MRDSLVGHIGQIESTASLQGNIIDSPLSSVTEQHQKNVKFSLRGTCDDEDVLYESWLILIDDFLVNYILFSGVREVQLAKQVEDSLPWIASVYDPGHCENGYTTTGIIRTRRRPRRES